MNEADMSRYIIETFEGVDVVTDSDNSFFFYNPDTSVPPDHKFPFVTLMTNDLNDKFSNLDRPGYFRLNIGISKETFRALFGKPNLPAMQDSMNPNAPNDSGFDFTAVDTLMPHPVYGRMYWVCVLNPSDETLATKVQPLLAEAYAATVSKYEQ